MVSRRQGDPPRLVVNPGKAKRLFLTVDLPLFGPGNDCEQCVEMGTEEILLEAIDRNPSGSAEAGSEIGSFPELLDLFRKGKENECGFW